MAENKIICEFSCDDQGILLHMIAISFDIKDELIISENDHGVACWDVTTTEVVACLECDCMGAFSPENNLMATATAASTATMTSDGYIISIWRRIPLFEMCSTIEPDSEASAMSFDSTGALLVTGHLDTMIRVWNVDSGALHRTLMFPGCIPRIEHVVFVPGSTIHVAASTYQNGTIIINTETNEILMRETCGYQICVSTGSGVILL